MSENSIAAELIRGKKNIRRMKEEIDTIIRMVRRSVSSFEFSGPAEPWEKVFSSSTCDWEVTFFRNLRRLEITAWVKEEGNVVGMAYKNRKNWNQEYIQTAHESLDCLIKGLMKEFPQLESELAPLRRAAEKQF